MTKIQAQHESKTKIWTRNNEKQSPSLGKRIGKGLQDFAKNMPKPRDAGGGSSLDDSALRALGAQVDQAGQAAQQQTAQSAARLIKSS